MSCCETCVFGRCWLCAQACYVRRTKAHYRRHDLILVVVMIRRRVIVATIVTAVDVAPAEAEVAAPAKAVAAAAFVIPALDELH